MKIIEISENGLRLFLSGSLSFAVEAMLAMAERSMYESRIQEILREYPCIVKPGVTQLTEYLYLGGYHEARNLELMHNVGITHVLNCAAFRKSSRNPYPEWTGVIGYRQFDANDDEFYDIIQHVPAAKSFIDGARRQGGKVFVHCARGINRSGALAIAYMMVDSGQDLLTVVKYAKKRRGMVLTNGNFRKQLIDFARKYGLLYPGQERKYFPADDSCNAQQEEEEQNEEVNRESNKIHRSNLNVVLSVYKT